MSKYAISVIGGDLRMAWLSQLLSNEGHIVKLHAQEENDFPFDSAIIHCCDAETAVHACDACILGIPCSRDQTTIYAPFSHNVIPFSSFLPLLTKDQYLFGGMLPFECGNSFDYARDESFIWANTIPTAEGALQLLMQHLPRVISGCPIAILGYGRVGQTTAQLLCRVGARITVYARDPIARTKGIVHGISCKALGAIQTDIQMFDAVINTVPSVILTDTILSRAHRETIFLELASTPGGFDMNAINNRQLSYIYAGGLPGKVAPRTAAQYIKNTVINRLEECM